METFNEIDNSFYEKYGERWYTAQDDPVALLRAENKIKFPWIMNQIKQQDLKTAKILDVGCGGGFLSNELAIHGFEVVGVDLSSESLKIAQMFDETQTVKYQIGDAYQLPFPDESFEIVTAMDFLEHVEEPDKVIKEISRVLKPRGLFFFHTFNRNLLSHIVIIKLVEWFIKNTPKNMHVIRLFIKPSELKTYCQNAGMEVIELTGIKPKISTIPLKMIFTGIVSPQMKFETTPRTWLSYLGMAIKK